MNFDDTQRLKLLVEQLYTDLVSAVDLDDACVAEFQIDRDQAAILYAKRAELVKFIGDESPRSTGAQKQSQLTLDRQMRWLMQRHNQFRGLSEEELSGLSKLTSPWLNLLRKTLMAAHNAGEFSELLHRGSKAYLRDLVTLATQSTQTRGQTSSEEYAVATQLEVLHLLLSELGEPVLDVGCGRHACLVKWLRNNHIDAIGIDLAASRTEGCLVADWFEFPFLPERLGTVVAHLSFSLQFLHQHLRPDGEAGRYARQYMAILHALRHGGRLIYAPGLPFIERLLPHDQYAVTRFGIERLPIDEWVMTIFTQRLKESPMYACHIERL